MINKTHLLIASIILLVFAVEKGFSIKCWECRSDSDPKCADPFDNSTLSITDCRQVEPKEHLPGVKATMCRKIRQKVHGEWRYFRSCAWMGEPGIEGDERFCLMRTGTYNIFMEYCTCNSKDGCNTGGKNNPKLLQIGLLCLLAVLIFSTIILSVNAIRCYQCSSQTDPKGIDNCGAYVKFNKTQNIAIECNSDESHMPGSFCMKVVQQGPRGFIWDGRWRQVIRRCASVADTGVTGVCNWGVYENGVYWEECYCAEDSCNNSTSIKVSMKFVFSLLIFITISKYLNS
ncbi:hypothetical protein PVAND_006658 [Polypedilum vanderplanki]|uniref:Protein sleepless n=1 Tax=Polypedilum vanderplanki TaxID=319348 RepID=A0A9J6C4V8_POLVA|nr:hypothetical protein PVAND_006658 [Polypedilum vanderplanki]